MALQPLKISNDDHADAATSENERRRAYLRRAFKIMLGLMGAFGTIRSSNSRQSKCSATFPTLRLLAVVCFFLLFLGQLTYLYLQASANLETATSLKLHFISRAQSTFNTALCLIILSRRTRKLPSVLFGIANACLWSDESQYRPLRRIVNFTVAYLGFIYGIMFPIGLIAKIVSVRGLNESLFGWSLPAEVVILSMFIIEATAISFRSIHLMTLIIMCLTLGMQFSHLTRSIKTSRQGGSIDKSAGDYGSCMGDLLYRHYRLSKLVHQFDAIFSASLFLFTASDVILLTSLMSYFISGSRLEASMGHYVTQSALDNGVFMFGAFGGVVLVLTRVMVTAYLSYEAESCVPELHMILENPNLDVDLEKHIHRSLQRLRDAPVTLTGWGLVSMNRSFILSVLGVLATYLVVVVQMSSNTGHSPQMECSCDIYGHESYSPSAF